MEGLLSTGHTPFSLCTVVLVYVGTIGFDAVVVGKHCINTASLLLYKRMVALETELQVKVYR